MNSSPMSAEELKSRLYQTLSTKGILNSLKCQLRNNLVRELQQSSGSKQPKQSSSNAAGEGGGLMQVVANSLVADHLNRCHYEYTLGVFLPESGTSQEKVFTMKDLLRLLHINTESKLYHRLVEQLPEFNKHGFLWQLLCELAACHSSVTIETSAQTELLINSESLTGALTLEEQILSYQKEIDERNQVYVKKQIEHFKQHELSHMRLDEREKNRQEVDKLRKEMEDTYRIKSEALLNREKKSLENLRHQQETAEMEMYQKRQQILQEIDVLRNREKEMRTEIESNLRERSLQDEKLKTMEQSLWQREQRVKQSEADFGSRLQTELEKFKIEELRRLLDRQKDVEIRELKLTEAQKGVQIEKESYHQMNKNLQLTTNRNEELEAKLQEVQREHWNTDKQVEIMSEKIREMVDYKSLKEENVGLKSEISNTKMRLAEANLEIQKERKRHDDLLHDMSEKSKLPSPELLILQTELQKLRDSMAQENAIHRHKQQQSEIRLRDEVDRNHTLARQVEEQTLQIREMNREITDLRQQLSQAQQALNNELYTKPITHRGAAPSNVMRHSSQSQSQDRYGSLVSRERPKLDHRYHSSLATRQERPEDDLMRNTRRYQYDDTDSPPDDSISSTSNLVRETKMRLQNLEQEAENLEESYRNFQHRVTNVNALPVQAPQSRSTRDTGQYLPPSRSPIVNYRAAILHPDVQRPHFDSNKVFTPIQLDVNSHSVKSPVTRQQTLDQKEETSYNVNILPRPLSSTPFKKKFPPGGQDHHSPPTHPEVDRLPSPSVSKLTDISPHSDTSQTENRVMKLADLEAQSDSPISPMAAKEPSIDEAVLKDQKNEENDSHHQDDDDDLKWEDQRRKREEERKRKQQEQWQKQQEDLLALQEDDKKKPGSGRDDQRGQVEEIKEIDPVMQKYMNMMEEKKQTEKRRASDALKLWNKNRQLSQDKIPSPEISENLSAAESIKSIDGPDNSW